jgi:hypothetical protein
LKGETNMAVPFEKMTTEKLNSYYEERVNSKSKEKETNQCQKKGTGNKLNNISRKLQTKRLREINS